MYIIFLQGDPGGIVGIIPQKGDRGLAGSSGLKVSVFIMMCLYTCLFILC